MVQARESSVFSRKIINLFAGMADGSPQLPSVLFANGYKIHSIERSFTVNPGQKVNAELLLCSEKAQHTLVIDAKSGANLKPDQLDRYACISEKSLRDSAFAPRAAAKSHNVLLVGKEEHGQRLLMGSAAVPSPVRVISLSVEKAPVATSIQEVAAKFGTLGDSGLKLIENKFTSEALNQAFSPMLSLDWDLVPINYLPVDHEAEDWEFAERLIPKLIILIQSGRSKATIEEIGVAIIGLWGNFVGDYKKQMIGRLTSLIKLAAQNRFSSYLSYGEKGFSKYEVRLKIPPSLAKNQAALRSNLSRQGRRLLEDLQSPQIAMVFDPNSIKI